MHDLPVRLIANGGGYVYAPLGPTHQATEDIAIMRALPNMAVVCPADADEMTRFMEASIDWPHPIYIRMAKGGDPVVTQGQGVSRSVKAFCCATTLAPIRYCSWRPGWRQPGVWPPQRRSPSAASPRGCCICRRSSPRRGDASPRGSPARLVVTVEEHSLIGGLGSAVSDSLLVSLEGRLPPLRKLGIPDIFAKAYGGQDDLMHDVGLQPPQIVATVEQALGLN